MEEKGVDLNMDGVAESLGLDAAALGGSSGAGGIDLSLKEGQTMSIKLNAKIGGAGAVKALGSGSGTGKLAAPGAPRPLAPPGAAAPAASAPAPAPAASEWETF